MTNKNKPQTSSSKENQNFEIDLFNALKSYGYLFPKDTKDVDNFENLYGNTEIETPPFVEQSKRNENLEIKNTDFNLRLAAFAPKSNNSISLPNNTKKGDADSSRNKDKI